ncbi:MAG: pilus assembly protein [Clostridiales bacterium]|nr:pilus assembly protein [Clostridiales bacterium]
MRIILDFVSYVSPNNTSAKALQCARTKGSFTVEAAFILPLFIFAAAVVIGMFPMLMIQMQVNSGLQYAARIMAVSYQDSEDEGTILSLTEGEILFRTYMREHGYEDSVLEQGLSGISLLSSDLSGDYVTLTASYEAELPVSFWSVHTLPVCQSVKMKKWTGAVQDEENEDGEEDWVYITPSGNAYHKTAECPYLKLSIRSVSVSELGALRNKSGGIYYACSCYKGGSLAYITDYGTQYHGDLNCSGLKRTIYKVSIENVGDRHACSKCY